MSAPAAAPQASPTAANGLPHGEHDDQQHEPLGGLAVEHEQDRREVLGHPAGEEVARAVAGTAGQGEQERGHRVLAGWRAVVSTDAS
jgi:hypothetical protein